MSICPEGFIEIVEGLAKICIPDPKLYTRANGVFEPAWAPVFYNPDMVENRDIAVEIVEYLIKNSITKEFTVVDPLAATGVRGIRMALEVSRPEIIRVFMGDISEESIKIMNMNVFFNHLKGKVIVEKSDACELLYRLRRMGIRINYIDVDPFGSPVPFSYASISTIMRGGVIAFTATDLAVLEGKYIDKLFRRYSVVGASTPISRDIAIRVLLSYIARVAYAFDRYVEPILSYTYKHYVRVYVRILEGAIKANNQVKTCLKTLMVCPYCGYSYRITEDSNKNRYACPLCGSHAVKIEPLWICKTLNKDIIEALIKDVELKPWIQRTSKRLLKTLYDHADIDSISLRLSLLARTMKINTPPKDKVIECLVTLGYKATKSYTYHDGIITNASIQDVVQCIKY